MRGFAIATALVSALGGCLGWSNSNEPVEQVSGAVAGQVTGPGGEAVRGPAVTVVVLTQPVNGQSSVLQQGTVIGDENGRYALGFVIDRQPPQTAVLLVSVLPPPATGLASRDTLGIPMRLDRGYPPRDTTFVQIRLPVR